jgi:hypothetical protein
MRLKQHGLQALPPEKRIGYHTVWWHEADLIDARVVLG